MKVIYYCYGAAHSSVTAANIHLGALPATGRAAFREILYQPLFDRAEDYDLGTVRLMGTTPDGDEVYVLGLAGGQAAMAPALLQFVQALGVAPGSIRLEDSLRHAGVLLRIGGYSSRRLRLVWLGRPLCALGVWFKYRRFSAHVTEVKRQLGQTRLP